jgi:hypothetical protein
MNLSSTPLVVVYCLATILHVALSATSINGQENSHEAVAQSRTNRWASQRDSSNRLDH